MSGLSPERLTNARLWAERTSWPADAVTALILHSLVSDLLAHVDHLTADNARLQEGIKRVRGHVHESWLHQGDVGLIEDALDGCDALLSPPTEGETDRG